MLKLIFFPFLLSALFLLSLWCDVGGDAGFFYHHLVLNKLHLLHSWQFPYFTPSLCGGFLLGANPQSMIFSIYQFFGMIVCDQILAIKIGRGIVSVIFALGIYYWLPFFNVSNRLARQFVAFLVVFSGYWITHEYFGGHVGLHSVAYIPWFMVLIERILKIKGKDFWNPELFWITVLVIFLMVNGGYVWLQVAFPLVTARLLIEIISQKGIQPLLKPLVFLSLSGFVALILSAPRLGGVYFFVLENFPRKYQPFQRVKDTVLHFIMVARSLWDPGLILNKIHSSILGGFHEYAAYVGLCSIPVFLIGLFVCQKSKLTPAFKALFFAVLYQLATTSTPLIDVVNFILPIFKNLLWQWRGFILLVFLYGVLLGFGFTFLLESKKRLLKILAVVLFLSITLDISYVLYRGGTLVYSPLKIANNGPLFSWGETTRNGISSDSTGRQISRCYDPLLGYGNEFFLSDVDLNKTYAETVQDGFLNLNDVRGMFDVKNKTDYSFIRWPLWPAKDKDELVRFMNYQQIVSLPQPLKLMNLMSLIVWALYLLAGILLAGRSLRLSLGKVFKVDR